MTFWYNIAYMVNSFVLLLYILVMINILYEMEMIKILHDKMLNAIYLYWLHNVKSVENKNTSTVPANCKIATKFWRFRGQISWNSKFWTNFRPKTKKVVRAVSEKTFKVWFWANLEKFSWISPNQDFFWKIRLCYFSTFIVP